MERLESHLDTNSAEFRANADHHRALADDLRRRLEAVRQGGGADAVKKHTSRGKLFVRDRVEKLLTPAPRSSNSHRSPPTASTPTKRRVQDWSPGSAGCRAGT
jgi:hypothetical protein